MSALARTTAPVGFFAAEEASPYAVTFAERRWDGPPTLFGAAPAREAVLVEVLWTPVDARRYWLGGKAVPRRDLAAGRCVFHDLRKRPSVVVESPYQALHVHIPLNILAQVAEDCGLTFTGHVEAAPNLAIDDPALVGLAMAIAQACGGDGEPGQVFRDQIGLAMATQVAMAYGALGVRTLRQEPVEAAHGLRVRRALARHFPEPTVAGLRALA